MSKNILLVFDDFDPISNYKLELINEALDVERSIGTVVFLYEKYKISDRVFQQDEKVALLGASIPNTPSPRYIIDGESFEKENESIFNKISKQAELNKGCLIFLLLDSKEYQILEQHKEWHLIQNSTTIILYVLPEHKELTESYSITSKPIIFINPTESLNTLSKASVLEVTRNNFNPIVIEYMNKSGECAIKRIKSHLTEERFKHCLRVAGTVKQICELTEEEDEELRYDSYLAALYHDICKELPQNMQKELAKETLGIEENMSWKLLHGPIGGWYVKNKYLLDNIDIIEAIEQHTFPKENPSKIVIYVYLADKLEIAKKDRFPEDIYNMTWDLIEQKKPIEAFNFLKNYLEEQKDMKEMKKRKEEVID